MFKIVTLDKMAKDLQIDRRIIENRIMELSQQERFNGFVANNTVFYIPRLHNFIAEISKKRFKFDEFNKFFYKSSEDLLKDLDSAALKRCLPWLEKKAKDELIIQDELKLLLGTTYIQEIIGELKKGRYTISDISELIGLSEEDTQKFLIWLIATIGNPGYFIEDMGLLLGYDYLEDLKSTLRKGTHSLVEIKQILELDEDHTKLFLLWLKEQDAMPGVYLDSMNYLIGDEKIEEITKKIADKRIDVSFLALEEQMDIASLLTIFDYLIESERADFYIDNERSYIIDKDYVRRQIVETIEGRPLKTIKVPNLVERFQLSEENVEEELKWIIDEVNLKKFMIYDEVAKTIFIFDFSELTNLNEDLKSKELELQQLLDIIEKKFELNQSQAMLLLEQAMDLKLIEGLMNNAGIFFGSARIGLIVQDVIEKDSPVSIDKIYSQFDINPQDREIIEDVIGDLAVKFEEYQIMRDLNHDFISYEYLKAKTKDTINVFNRITIEDLSKELQIRKDKTEDLLIELLKNNEIYGSIDRIKNEFVRSAQAPPARVSEQTASRGMEQASDFEVVREFDYVGGQIRFKVVARNRTNLMINNIKLHVDVPDEFHLVRITPETSVEDLAKASAKIDKLPPGGTRGVDFYLEPVACGIGMISGIVNYQDAQGHWNAAEIRPKEVPIKCPLVVKPEDVSVAVITNLIEELPSDYKRFTLPIDGRSAFNLLDSVIKTYEVNKVKQFDDPDKIGEIEAWYYTRAKVTNHQIAISCKVSEKQKYTDIKIACENQSELTGLLAKIAEDFEVKLKENAIQAKNVMGKLKELLCNCGAPISNLPTPTTPVTCQFCGATWTHSML